MNYTAKSISLPIDLLRLATGLNDSEKSKIADALQQLATILRSMEERKAVACPYCDDTGDVHSIDGEWRGECTACPVAIEHAFKNFHKNLCERFGYTHDDVDWRRDQIYLEEFIAKKITHPPAESGEAKDAARWRRLNAGGVADERARYIKQVVERVPRSSVTRYGEEPALIDIKSYPEYEIVMRWTDRIGNCDTLAKFIDAMTAESREN